MPDRRAPSEPSDDQRIPQSVTERTLKKAVAFVLVLVLAIYFGVAAIALILRYGVLPHIDSFRPRIEASATKAIGTPVHIGQLRARWRGLTPEITVSDVSITGADGQPALSVNQADGVLSWTSLVRLQPIFSSLRITGVDLVAARAKDGTLSVAGVKMGRRGGNPYAFANWLLNQEAVIVRQTSVRWRDTLRDAPELTLTNLRLAMLNDGRAHRLGVQAAFEDAALGDLDLRVQFRERLLSGLFPGTAGERGNPRNWSGHAYLSTPSVDLPTIAHYLDLPIAANSGVVHSRSWFGFSGGKVDTMTSDLQGENLALRVNPKVDALAMPRVALHFSAKQQDNTYSLSIHDLSLAVIDPTPLADGTRLRRLLDVSRFDGEYRAAGVGRGERIALSGDVVDIGMLADFSRALPLPQRFKNNVDRYEPNGVLDDYRLEWERQAPTDAKTADAARTVGNLPVTRYRLQARLDGVSLDAQEPPPGLDAAGHPHPGQPGFTNLRGVIQADQSGGTLSLASRQASVTVRGMFDEPTIPFDTLDGEVNWTISPDAGDPVIDANITALTFANADTAGQLTGRFHTPIHHAHLGHLSLSGTLSRASMPAIPRYLPTSIGAPVRAYLAHSMLAGDAHDIHFEVHGRLPDLPYPHGPDIPGSPHEPSMFTVDAPFENARIDVSPYPAIHLSNGDEERWPPFEAARGRFIADGRKLGFDIDSARYRNVHLTQTKGRIDDLPNMADDMMITGLASGPLADMIDFVNHSPLGFWSGHTTETLHAEGNATLALKLAIPRHHGQAADAMVAAGTASNTASPRRKPVGVSGSLTFKNNLVALDKLPAVSALSGRSEFTARSLSLHALQGHLLGGDFTANGGMQTDGSLDLSVDGRIEPHTALAETGPNDARLAAPIAALLQRLSGTAPYAVRVARTGHGAPALSLTSDLQGLGINLPAPLGKPADTTLPLSLTWRTLVSDDGTEPAAGKSTAGSSTARPSRPGHDLRELHTLLPGLTKSAAAGDAPSLPPAPPPLQRIDMIAGPVRASYLRKGRSGDIAPEIISGAIGVNRTPPLPKKGVVASVSLDSFDADAWRAAVMQIAPAWSAAPLNAGAGTAAAADKADKAGTAAVDTTVTTATTTGTTATIKGTRDDGTSPLSGFAAWLPSRFDIDIADLMVLSRHWNDLVLTGNRSKGQGWQAQIDARQVNGSLEWQPEGGSAINARFSKLIVPETDPALVARGNEAAKAAPAPATNPIRHYPAIDLVADHFAVGKREFGKLEVVAHNIEAGGEPVWSLDRLALGNAAAQLNASGDWRTSAASRDTANPAFQTALKFVLSIKDGGALLTDLGLPRTLRDGHGSLEGMMSWRGSPGSIDTASLDGTLKLDLQKGQILKVDPGAARLLGVLSLQGLARFLQLDFKGLFGQGLAFDKLDGTASVKNGIAVTNDFSLSTTPARVTMRGSANIPQEQQDLLVTVVPHLNAGSASIAAAVVNPLLGLGSLVAQLVLSDPIAKTLTRHYRIDGPWSKPHIQRIDLKQDARQDGNQPSNANRGNIASTTP